MRIKSFLLLSLIILTSCASLPNAKPNSNLKTLVGDERTTYNIPQWWTTFNDNKLDSVISLALSKNFDIQMFAARLVQSNAQAKIAGAPLLPIINLNGTSSRRKQNFLGFPIPRGDADEPLSTTTNNYNLSLAASWELDIWGKLRAEARAAFADARAAEADYDGAQLSLTAQTARAYLTIVESKGQVELARATLENYKLSSEQVERRYVQGLTTSLDVRLARSNVASAEAALFQRRQMADQAHNQLLLLLGQTLTSNVETVTNLNIDIGPPPPDLPASLVKRRPDIIAAERRLAAAEDRLKSAKRQRLPIFNLTASNGAQSNDLIDIVSGNFSVWNLVGNLSQPLFQGGRLRANQDHASAGVDFARATYEQIALRAYIEVSQALKNEALLSKQTKALRIASIEAKFARILAEDRYSTGVSNITTLMNAQRREFDSESRLLSVQRQRLNARIDLYMALGGDFEYNDIVPQPAEKLQ